MKPAQKKNKPFFDTAVSGGLFEKFVGKSADEVRAMDMTSGGTDTVAAFVYAPTQDGVMRPDDALKISVALDDGSIYAFDATTYSARAVELSWDTDEDAALATLPDGTQAASARPLIIKSPGGSYLACWELTIPGEDPDAPGVRVYVDAGTGRQCKVELG